MSVPKRFGVLRLVGTLLKVIAWIILIVSILAAIGLVLVGNSDIIQLPITNLPSDPALMDQAGGIIFGIGILLVGLIYFLVLYASGETFHLQLAVEENTRLTAALLLRMHQDAQPDPAPRNYGAGGFANEFDR